MVAESLLLSKHGFVPNNPSLPVLLYCRAVKGVEAETTAAEMEALFDRSPDREAGR